MSVCAKCGITNENLVKHHLDYTNNVTELLCRSCHRKLHVKLRKNGTRISGAKVVIGSMRTTVVLPDELWAWLKKRAIDEKRDLNDVIVEGLEIFRSGASPA